MSDRQERGGVDAGTMAHALSHELRSSLSAASYACELVRGRVDDAGVLEYLERVDGALAEAGSLLDGFVQYADALSGSLERRPVDLQALLDEVFPEVSAGLVATDAELESDAPLPTVVGDPTWLRVLLRHLVRNALVHGVGDGSARVRVSPERDGERWRIRVDDAGPGVAQADRERIFELFEAGGRAGTGGAGVGLALCRAVTRRHDGRIWVERSPSGGARFVVELPTGDG